MGSPAPTTRRGERLTEKRFWGRIAALEKVAELKGSKFPKDTPAAQLRRKARAVVRPEFFNTTYLPHYFHEAVAAFHLVMYAALETALRIVVEVPRGHGKSTAVTFAYCLHQVVCAEVLKAWAEGTLQASDPALYAAIVAELRDLHAERQAEADALAEALGEELAEVEKPALIWDPYIQITAVTVDLATEFTESIKIELENNARIAYDWGVQVTDRGVNYADFVSVSDVRVRATGMLSGNRGSKHKQYRPTLCIVDDPDDRKTISKRELRDAQQKVLTAALRYGLAPDCRVFVVGTRLHYDCLTARLMNSPNFDAWKRIRFQAIQEDGTPLWPERWSLARLLEAKAEDEDAFEQEMMNQPPGEGQKLFARLYYYDRGGPECLAAQRAIQAFDPSLGKTDKSDEQANIVLRFADTGPILVERAELTRIPPRELAALVMDVHEDASPDELVMETIGFQTLLQVLMEDDPRYARDLPAIIPLDSQVESKDVRIASLATPIRQRDLLFPSDGSCRRLERRFLDYGEPGVKKDGPDATEMAVRRIRQLRRGGNLGIRQGGTRRDLSEGGRGSAPSSRGNAPAPSRRRSW